MLRVDAVWARRVVAELDRAGCRGGPADCRGLRREQLTAPDALIPFHAHVMLFENAARALREPCFGFRLGSAVELTEAGLLAYVIVEFARSGRGAAQPVPLPSDPDRRLCVRAAPRGRRGAVASSLVDPVESSSRQLTDFGATLMVRICEAITGHRVRPLRIELRHEPPAPCWPGSSACRCWSISRVPRWFSTPRRSRCRSSNADARLLDLLRRYADEVLARRAAKDDLVGRAERWILDNLHTGQVGVPAAGPQARHERSGRWPGAWPKAGADAGWAWSTTCAAGSPTNIWPSLPFSLGRITYLLGYSDLSAFTRAFRRWTGRAPSEWRAGLSALAAQPPASPALPH